MKIKTSKEFLTALKTVKPAAQPKGTLPILAYVKIESLAPDRIRLTCTDLGAQLQADCVADVQDPGELLVKIDKLSAIMPEGGDAELSGDHTGAQLKFGRSRYKLESVPASDFPLFDPVRPECAVSLPGEALQAALEKTLPCMAVKDVRYYLNGILIDIDDKKTQLVALDGHRGAMTEIDVDRSKANPGQWIIPRETALQIKSILSGETEISLSHNYCSIRSGAGVMTARLIDGKYPQWREPIKRTVDAQVAKIPRSEMIQSIMRLQSIGDIKGARLVFNKSELIITNWDQLNEGEERITIESEFDDHETAFNLGYLATALNAMSSESIEMRVNQHGAYFREGGFQGIVSPVRI